MKKGLLPKIVAFLALFGIIIGILGTALLFILSPKGQINNNEEVKLTPEQIEQLQKLSNMSGVTIGGNGSGEIN